MGTLKRIRYRAWQFWQAVKARPFTEKSKQEIGAILSEGELKLFKRQNISAQQHSYRVMRTLKSAGQDNPELLAAALLHDVGMTEVKTVWWDRPLVVLVETLFPEKSVRWAEGDLSSWRRPFVVRANHATWGAKAADGCGSSELTIELIRRHQDPHGEKSKGEFDEMLAWLQWADDMN